MSCPGPRAHHALWVEAWLGFRAAIVVSVAFGILSPSTLTGAAATSFLGLLSAQGTFGRGHRCQQSGLRSDVFAS